MIADSESGAAFVRNILELSDSSADARRRSRWCRRARPLDKLFASGFAAVIAIAPASKIMKDKSYEQYAKRGGFTLNAIEAAKRWPGNIPALSEETVAAGTLSSSPAIPEDDVETVGLQWLLVAQSRMSTTTVGELARLVYENKAELALDNGFASRIEPAATDKDAFIVAHPGAAEYINDDTKSFVERYSDLMYFGAAALGIIGSILRRALHQGDARSRRRRPANWRPPVLDIGERMEDATSLDAARRAAGRARNDTARRGDRAARRHHLVATGSTRSSSAIEFVRDEIGMRREHLKRHPPAQDDNVVVVKTAQSA